MSPYVKKLCIRPDKKQPAEYVNQLQLSCKNGIMNDYHSHQGDFQVSLFLDECQKEKDEVHVKYGVDGFCTKKFEANITTRGLDFSLLEKGSRLAIGSAEIEITKAGKDCHEGCPLRKFTHDCVMLRACAFARILKSGEIKQGDIISIVNEC